MGRIARVVVRGMAHHVTQRGNRRQRTFFCDDDYQAYLQLMAPAMRTPIGPLAEPMPKPFTKK
jgi:REP element-mobilizing transposase RayT